MNAGLQQVGALARSTEALDVQAMIHRLLEQRGEIEQALGLTHSAANEPAHAVATHQSSTPAESIDEWYAPHRG